MRSGRREQSQNLDSLLDTMANVVGILVVVMAFTQIQIGEAVRRIHDSEVAKVQSIGEALAFAGEGALREVNRLEEGLQSLQQLAAIARDELRQLNALSESLAALTRLPRIEQTDVVTAIIRETEKEREMRDELDALRANREILEVRLRDSQSAAANANHQVRLPNPRPAPADTKELVFFCRYGRVGLVDLNELHRVLNVHLREAAGSPRGGTLAASVVVGHFERNDVGDRNFRWRLSDQAGLGIAARLEFRREQIGETRSELIADDSEYERILSAASQTSHYLRFFVWSDSFAAYLRARQIAEEQGFAVGWEPYDSEREHEGILQANVLHEAIPID
jgi:hypothetical protein